MKKILVIYFSQTGQAKRLAESILSGITDSEIEFAEIKPEPEFPFPWTSDEFFQAFPESFMGIPCSIKNLSPTHGNSYDLVILAHQPWYLSPSIPIHSFLQSEEAKYLLNGKPVITIIGSRNMWLMAQEKVKKYILDAGGKLYGNIAFYDRAYNLVSIITIIRWLIKGKKEKSLLFPRAGVSETDIENAKRFTDPIMQALSKNYWEELQDSLNKLNAIKIKPDLLLFERNGTKIFRMWAKKILKKGQYGDIKRKGILKIFKYYLLTVLFIVSPLGSLFFLFIKPFIIKKIKRDKHYFSQNSLL